MSTDEVIPADWPMEITYEYDVKGDKIRLGSGGQTTGVFLGKYKEKKVAVKLMLAENQRAIESEAILKLLGHENIVRLFATEMRQEGPYIFWLFALELCETSLDKCFSEGPDKYTGPMPSEKDFLLQLANGLNHIHEQEYFHRDIKPLNTLISVKQDGTKKRVTMKWADFGLSRKVNERGSRTYTTFGGTLDWVAPEVISRPPKSGRETNKSDVFSEGLVFGYYLLGGRHPYVKGESGIMTNILLGKFDLSGLQKEELCQLIKKMLTQNPEDRYSSGKVLTELERIYEKPEGGRNRNRKVITFYREQELGRGGFSVVYRGTYNNKPVAVKRFRLFDGNFKSYEEATLRKLNADDGKGHANVIKFFHSEEDYDFRYLAVELCDATLADYYTDRYEGPEMPSTLQVLLQLADGLAFIHSRKIAHRDISPNNILIKSVRDGGFAASVQMKWSGFTVSQPCEDMGEEFRLAGTLNWMSPELLELLQSVGIGSAKRNLDLAKSDVFSEGNVFAYIHLDGKHPYGNNNAPIPSNIVNNQPVNLKDNSESDQPIYYRGVIDHMLESDVELRWTSEKVFQELQEIDKEVHSELFSVCNQAVPDVIELDGLIQNGVDLNRIDLNTELTPILALCKPKRKRRMQTQTVNESASVFGCLKTLLQRHRASGSIRVDVNCKNTEGNNALMLLCQHYRNDDLLDVVKLLVEDGIDLKCKNQDGKTALDILESRANKSIADGKVVEYLQ